MCPCGLRREGDGRKEREEILLLIRGPTYYRRGGFFILLEYISPIYYSLVFSISYTRYLGKEERDMVELLLLELEVEFLSGTYNYEP